ncbi:sodium- and chloride-dependent glycine transporter 2-like [Uloborus diversus]|uniref:sodium- and chloride-dependent glycine transporter 2-like n=1 Tax=Uloborus diversus TaxID=327109 RepID=UPI00240A2E22|nr:sodium- and chloride-dependent glycine transporter 2-like [Uloborus diversus]
MVVVDIKVPSTANGTKPLTEKEDQAHEKWANKAEFLLSCIGLSVGIGNVWRFPYQAYQNGGGAFLVAYVVVLALVGKPHYFAELAIGQFSGLGPVRVWRCIPIAKGVGVAMVLLSVMVCIYYNVIMSYTLYYIVQSFRSEVPWQKCNDWWGADEMCYVRKENQTNCRDIKEQLVKFGTAFIDESVTGVSDNYTYFSFKGADYAVHSERFADALNTCSNGTQTASEQFWERYVLGLTSGIDDLGSLKWDLTLSLFVCWMICFLGLMKGIKSSGKIVYFTATFPYVILVTLVIYGCSLNGASSGLKYFFIPEWGKLLDIKVWKAAVEQLLFSLSLGWGSLIVYASYNKFDNTLQRDALFVSLLDFATSLLAGIVIFAVLGNLAHEMNVDISKVAKQGQGLAFVTYPEALARLPVPQLWSILFFFMLFLLAIDSEFSYLENVFTAIYDEFPHLKSKRVIITFSCCMLFFLLGLPNVTQGGQYVLNLMDRYGGGYAGIFVATFEISFIMWGYGAERFADDLEFMLGFRPGLYWRLCWKYISPVVLWVVLIYSFFTHEVITYGNVPYPMWAEYVGWALIMVSVLQIPIWAAVELYRRKSWRAACQPHRDWGPSNSEMRLLYEQIYSAKHSDTKCKGIDNLAMDRMNGDIS